MPKHVTFMDDWAFANCNQLARVELPGRQMEFGKGVFQGCVSLGKIVAGTSECRTEEEQQRAEQVGALLAATVNGLDAYHLFAFVEAVFADGNEMLILVTELTVNTFSARFITMFGCEDYQKHNEKLMLSERQNDIKDELNELLL